MLQRALMHARAAMALRDCAARTDSVSERRFLTSVALLHEARARRFMKAARR